MKRIHIPLLALAMFAAPGLSFADPDKDESGHGKHRKGRAEYKHEYWDGNCKVERKLEKNGDYKEERKCKGHAKGHKHGHRHEHAHVTVVQPVYVAPAPVVVLPPPRPDGIVINGTIHLK